MYLEMQTNWLIPKLVSKRHDYLFQEDGAPPHWYLAVRTFLNEHLPNSWIGRGWTKWPGVLQVAPEITAPDRLWLFPLGVREGQSLCTSTTRNRGWAAGTDHCSCQFGHAGYAAESLVRARLSHRCLPSNKMGAHSMCVIPHETVSVYVTVTTNFVRIFQ